MVWWADARNRAEAYSEEGADSGCTSRAAASCSSASSPAVKRILKMMMKRASLKRNSVEVARNCTEADISVTFYAMVGFPTETREEARERFASSRSRPTSCARSPVQTFLIDEVAKTYKEPEQFGIEVLLGPVELALYHDYEARARHDPGGGRGDVRGDDAAPSARSCRCSPGTTSSTSCRRVTTSCTSRTDETPDRRIPSRCTSRTRARARAGRGDLDVGVVDGRPNRRSACRREISASVMCMSGAACTRSRSRDHWSPMSPSS